MQETHLPLIWTFLFGTFTSFQNVIIEDTLSVPENPGFLSCNSTSLSSSPSKSPSWESSSLESLSISHFFIRCCCQVFCFSLFSILFFFFSSFSSWFFLFQYFFLPLFPLSLGLFRVFLLPFLISCLFSSFSFFVFQCSFLSALTVLLAYHQVIRPSAQ